MIRRAIPFDTGPLHFVGIGGIGMSGIASVMKTFGYEVTGSDAKDGPNIERLRGQGIWVSIGHKAENAANAGVVVISSAIKNGNPEVEAARARGIPVVKRAEMLAEIMRLKWTVAIGGTHGKTTTTSMVAALLDAGGKDPTVINGGIINAYGANTRMGEGEWMVVEADESDGTFTRLRATAVVVTNMDPEHLDHYGSVDAMNYAYCQFVENIPFYGFAVMCVDHPDVKKLADKVRDRRIIRYGFADEADVRAVNVRVTREGVTFDVVARRSGYGPGVTLHDLFLPVAGRHNLQNAVAAIAVARELGVTDAGIRKGLKSFAGVKRRFTTVGYWNDVRIVDDYGHHPVEIAAVLQAAREMTQGRVIAIAQPHRYTRLRDLFEGFCTCFSEADVAAIADIYSAGEQPIEGVTVEALVNAMKERGHPDPRHIASLDQLADFVRAEAKPGDIVVCLGAGDITHYANALPAKLAAAAAVRVDPGRDSAQPGSMPDTAHRPSRPRAALIYDFDGTLARGNLQERSFIPDIAGMKHADFWMEVKRLAKAEDADEILVYMHLMLDRARAAGRPVTRKQLQETGADPDFFDGLDHWFERMDAYADDLGVELDHYVISSGIYEMIEGCRLFGRFRQVFASRFLYDKKGEAKWPGVAINYTTKTQFLFRINKGIETVHDTEAINRWMHNDARALPFERMIFIGDGDTDIPSMKMVTSQGGCAVAVLDPYQWTEPRSLEKISRLIAEDRVSYVAPADYQPQSQLDVIVKGALGRIARRAGLPVEA